MTTELRGVLAARASSGDGADEDEATISYRRSDACLIAFAYVPAVLFFIENAFEMCLGGGRSSTASLVGCRRLPRG